MAMAFQAMLMRFGLEKKILAFNADNATSNDTQTTKLAALDNSFEEVNRVRCFNHTLQLSAKELIKPFNAGMGGARTVVDDGDMPVLEDPDGVEDEDDDDTDEGGDGDDVQEMDPDADDADDGIDELDTMGEAEQEELMRDTAAVHEAVTKVRSRALILILRLTQACQGPPARLRHYPFHHHCIARMAQILCPA
jgi:hypothetical protein